MNFFISSILSILAVSVYASDSSSSSSGCEPSFSSDSCDITSSSSCSYSSEPSPRLCAKELAMIEEQPCLPIVNYMRKLEAEVRANAIHWFLGTSRTETVVEFANRYGIQVKLANALGYAATFPNPVTPEPIFDASVMRVYALNKGVYVSGLESDVYYSFQMITPEGQYMLVQFIVPRSQLPLNNIKYKRSNLYC